MIAKVKEKVRETETKRIYIDLSSVNNDLLRQLAFDARVSKKRFLEALVEKEAASRRSKR